MCLRSLLRVCGVCPYFHKWHGFKWMHICRNVYQCIFRTLVHSTWCKRNGWKYSSAFGSKRWIVRSRKRTVWHKPSIDRSIQSSRPLTTLEAMRSYLFYETPCQLVNAYQNIDIMIASLIRHGALTYPLQDAKTSVHRLVNNHIHRMATTKASSSSLLNQSFVVWFVLGDCPRSEKS